MSVTSLVAAGVLASMPAAEAGAGIGDAYTGSKTLLRAHLKSGLETVAASNNVSITVSVNTGLRDGQPIAVRWTGAHPTGGLVDDQNSANASGQEYPVVVMQCRGTDTEADPITPQTCWTQTPAERYVTRNQLYAPFRMDRYATAAERGPAYGRPDPFPVACQGTSTGPEHWVHFLATDGTDYPGGRYGCAGLPPESANSTDALNPGSTTYGATDVNGNGAAKFFVQTANSNVSLGCSSTVACRLVVIPIMGMSCDDTTTPDLPRPDRPAAWNDCTATGKFAPGAGGTGDPNFSDLAVTGTLWWAASNWRNRFSIPLNFAPENDVCDVVSGGAPLYLYGSQAARQMMSQWGPEFCTNPKLFKVRNVQTSEPQAKNLLRNGSVEAAIQLAPPSRPFTTPTVQAPIAITGFAIAYSADDSEKHPFPRLRLNARLLVKLLSQSYQSLPFIGSDYAALATNPLDITADPEFRALNPTAVSPLHSSIAASALYTVSSDSDVMWSLTSYINADPAARAWLDGTPDPWGMTVNPSYKGIELPTVSWPLNDSFVSPTTTKNNACFRDNPVPWLSQVQSPVSDPSVVALNMTYVVAASQVFCKNEGLPGQKLVALGRQSPGSRFQLGVVNYADAQKGELQTVELETQSTVSSTAKFTSDAGRTFAGIGDASLKKAVAMLKPVVADGTWPVPYAAMRATPAGRDAYPGVLLMSADVPTKGLSKSVAAKYATFLRYAASVGQKPGRTNGTLPAGYLPMTTANGAGALAAYTVAAAAAVEAQAGVVPRVDGVTPTPTATPTPTPTPTSTPSASTTSTAETTPEPDSSTGETSSAEPTSDPSPTVATPTRAPVSASATPTPSPSVSPSLASAGMTPRIPRGSGFGGLPYLLALSVFSGVGALVMGVWGRS